MNLSKWEKRFSETARLVASWSPDPSTKVGAVIANSENLLLSWGFNAFPRKITSISEAEVEREVKYKYVIHAEANAIYNATRNGILLKDSIIYIYGLPPCIECAKAIIQIGAKKVITITDPKKPVPCKWIESYDDSKQLFKEVGIECEIINLS